MIQRVAWKIILGYILLRPFVSELSFRKLDVILSVIFLLSFITYTLKKQFKIELIDKAIFVFFLSILLSRISLTSITVNLIQMYKYLSLMALFYAMRLSTKTEQKQLIYVLIAGASLVSLYSLRSLFVVSHFVLEYLVKNDINNTFAERFLTWRRAFAPFISPNLLAGYLVMMIMFSLGIILQKQKERNALFFLSIFCLLIGFITLFFSKSVGGWFILIVSLSLFLFLGKLLNKKTIFVILPFILLLGIVIVNRTQKDKYFAKPLFSLNKRISYWKETAGIIRKHPIKGIGAGNFSLKETRAAHNSYLQVWAEMGILGLLSWLTIVFIFLNKGINTLRSRNNYYNLGVVASGLSFLLHNMIEFSFFISESAFLFWIILGITLRNERANPALRKVPGSENQPY